MKTILSIIVSLWAFAAQAEVITLSCKQADENKIGRAEEIQKVNYVLDTKSGTGKLECSEETDGDFCGSMRMDISNFISASVVDPSLCKTGQSYDYERQIFNFILRQEDEFDNLVLITILKKCGNGKIDPAPSAVITHNISGVSPEHADVVECTIVPRANK